MVKVENFYNKNQFLIREDNKIIFQSYNSIIAIWDYSKKKLTLGYDWDYSTTTSKHLYYFISDYVNDREIEEVNEKANKRQYINKLIEKNVILYDEDLR